MKARTVSFAVGLAATSAVGYGNAQVNASSASPVTANTCIEKLATGASKERCEVVAQSKRSAANQQRSSNSSAKSVFLSPRSPGTGVATAPPANFSQK
jgi:ribosomal protein S5